MPGRLLTPVMMAAVHAALGTLARQLADADGGAVQSLVDPIVFLALPAAVKAMRFRRLAAEIAKREEEKPCHPPAKSSAASWAPTSPAKGRGRKRKRG